MLQFIIFQYMLHGHVHERLVTPDQLIDAIGEVESGRGKTSANVYQLSWNYVADVRRITGQCISHSQAIASDDIARTCIVAYWEHYGREYNKRTGKIPNAEALARIHNGGPEGWRKPQTRDYWRKVSRVLINDLHIRDGVPR